VFSFSIRQISVFWTHSPAILTLGFTKEPHNLLSMRKLWCIKVLINYKVVQIFGFVVELAEWGSIPGLGQVFDPPGFALLVILSVRIDCCAHTWLEWSLLLIYSHWSIKKLSVKLFLLTWFGVRNKQFILQEIKKLLI